MIEERFPVYVISPVEDAVALDAIGVPSLQNDVLGRYVWAAGSLSADAVMRVTGDCPFLDPAIAKEVYEAFCTGNYDYVANDIVKTYPDGLGVEIITTEALQYADEHSPPDMPEREHVTPFIIRHLERRNPQTPKLFEGLNIRCPSAGLSNIKLSVDTPSDLALARAIHSVGPRSTAMADTLVAYRKVMDGKNQGST